VNDHGSAASLEHVIKLDRISFQTKLLDASDSNADSSHTSYRPPMVGVFAKQRIKRGEILITIPDDCIMTDQNYRLRESSGQVIDKALDVYQQNLKKSESSIKTSMSVWDTFYKNPGPRVSSRRTAIDAASDATVVR
jgi:hypothetical protein